MNEFEAMRAMIMSVADYMEKVEEPNEKGEKIFDGELKENLSEMFDAMTDSLANAVEKAFRSSYADLYASLTVTAIESITDAIKITADAVRAYKAKEAKAKAKKGA